MGYSSGNCHLTINKYNIEFVRSGPQGLSVFPRKGKKNNQPAAAVIAYEVVVTAASEIKSIMISR